MRTRKLRIPIVLTILAVISFSQLILTSKSNAQGNLQFNKVKLVSTLETVPAGKVWKLETALGPAIISNCSTNPMHTIKINGTIVNVGTSGTLVFDTYCHGWRGIGIVTEFPIWLPENTTLEVGNNVSSINVIEFNIIP